MACHARSTTMPPCSRTTSPGSSSVFYVPGPLAPMEANEARYLSWHLDELAAPA